MNSAYCNGVFPELDINVLFTKIRIGRICSKAAFYFLTLPRFFTESYTKTELKRNRSIS